MGVRFFECTLPEIAEKLGALPKIADEPSST
jgi:hypothetical protein